MRGLYVHCGALRSLRSERIGVTGTEFRDLVEFKTAHIMYKRRNNLLPGNIQKLFTDREGGYNFRRILNMKLHSVRTNIKSMCIWYCGVVLQNGMEENIKQSKNITQFKKMYKNYIFRRYRNEEQYSV